MASHIERRKFLATFGGAAATWPLPARAQQAAMPVVGFLSSSALADRARYLPAFRQGVRETGYVEGQNVVIEYRWAQDQHDVLPDLAADLVRRQVTVIAAHDTSSAVVAKAATTTIPIVFVSGGDPVKLGLVPSLNRPGGNVTGVTFVVAELGTKQLGLLHELVAKATTIGILANPLNPAAEGQRRDAQEAAARLGVQLIIVNATAENEFEPAFATLAHQRVDALLVAADSFFASRREQLVALAARHSMPAIYELREFAEAGGLISYGTNLADSYRQVGAYTGRILKGTTIAELPVVRSTKFEFVINLRTAKALGLEVPNSLQLLADEVIE